MPYFGIEEEFGPEIEQAFEDFINEITRLVGLWGYDNVAAALKLHFALFDPEGAEFLALRGAEPLPEAMGQAGSSKTARELGAQAVDWLKGLFRRPGQAASKAGKKSGGKLKKAGALGLTGLAGKELIDQLQGYDDVIIAGITTDDPITVSPSLEFEELMGRTTAAIENMTNILIQTQRDLGKGIADVDTGLEDVVAVSTGETAAQVHARQEMGVSAPAMKKPAAEKEKASAKTKKADPKRDKKKA